jgi:DNA polymerase III epsilon subunit-like protein
MVFLCFDTETTGLLDNCNVLTAYFIILDNDLNEIDSLDLKIKHNTYIVQTKALEINKINLIEHEKTAIKKADAKEQLEQFLSKYKQNEKYIPLGHNINFDLKMLKNNQLLSDAAIECYFSPNDIDTLTIAKFMKSCKKIPIKQSLSLVNLCNYFNICLDTDLDPHNAEYDIKMTIKLFKVLQSMIDT